VKFKKICVIGLGYIGLPTASMFATHGVRVVGVDNNPDIVNCLRNHRVHIFEPGLDEVVQHALSSGNLEISDQPGLADAFIIAVPTPFDNERRADMRAVISATESILPHLRKGNLVILESTSPPRTTIDLVVPILERSGLKAGKDFFAAYSPERVLPGQIMRELIENARVIGGIDEPSARAGRDLYGMFVNGEIYTTTATTAEMVKLMENTYRDINIAAANEFARLADRFGIDIWEAIQLANKHPRVKILNPGPGVGGHCISVDPWFLVEAAPDITPLIHTARKVNDHQPIVVVELAAKILGGTVKGKKIAVLGLSYKPDVDDLRESPAVEVAQLLVKNGASVLAFEPFKPAAEFKGFKTVRTIEEAFAGSDAILLLVNHTQFKSLDPVLTQKLTHGRIIIDTVNGWDVNKWTSAGFTVHRLGVSTR
jgi:UDP-N-acetyl-D-mannosaminuronic acid dehydrogenase